MRTSSSLTIFEKAPLQISVGNFYPYSSLETMTSSRLGSMLERASFTDAFNYNRRLGIGLQCSDKATDSYLIQAGIFSTPINDATFTRTGWQASLRALYTPTLGSTRLHVGANFQHRSNNQESMGQQYRTRPLTQITDQRFIDTGTLASKGDDTVGLEFAAIHKSLHVAAEAQKVWVRHAFNAAELAATNGDPDDNDVATGTALNGNPSFLGGYFELGYFLTGETRAYKGGKWDRTKVQKPFNKGGWGALQINGRVDYVDLEDRVDSSSGLAWLAPYLRQRRQAARPAGERDLEPGRLGALHGSVRPHRGHRRPARGRPGRSDQARRQAQVRRRHGRRPAPRSSSNKPFRSTPRKERHGPLARMYGEGAFILSTGLRRQAASTARGRWFSSSATKVNRPSVTLTSVAPRSRLATTSIRTPIDVRPTRSTSA